MTSKRGRKPNLDGFAIVHAMPSDRPLSFAVYLKARTEGRLGEFVQRTRRCPTCSAASRLQIRYRDDASTRRNVGCPACVPETRWCKRCEQDRPVTDFDISPSRSLGFKLETYCKGCRRERLMERYRDRRDNPPDRPKRLRCSRCERELSAKKFYEHGSYRHGLQQPCKQCKAEIENAYYGTPEGKAARDRATARYRGWAKGYRKITRLPRS